jgi:uncharacterized membrane protein
MSRIGEQRSRGGQRTSEQQAAEATTLTVWFYDSPMGAAAGQVRLRGVSPYDGILVLDAVTMTWIPGTHAPRVGQLRQTAAGAARGTILGPFVICLLRTGGERGAAAVDALAHQLGAPGLDREFLQEMKDRLAPGTSALLVLSVDTDLDAIRRVIERGRARGEVTLMHALLPRGAAATFSGVAGAGRLVPQRAGSPVVGEPPWLGTT